MTIRPDVSGLHMPVRVYVCMYEISTFSGLSYLELTLYIYICIKVKLF